MPRLAALLLLASACGGGAGAFAIVSAPATTTVFGEPYEYRIAVANAADATAFELLLGPPGMNLDAAGRLTWTPQYADLGAYSIRVEARAASATATQSWTLRVTQGVLLGTALSPRGHTSSSTAEDFAEHYGGHAPWGRAISFHVPWRESGSGAIPATARAAMLAAQEHGFYPVIGIGWTDGSGAPDLVSASDPLNNSWSNLETRALFRTMVEQFARQYRPPALFLGNETNVYFLSHSATEWANWMSQLAACYAAVKRVSPETLVYSTFQYERLKGLGAHSGWADPPQLQLLDELVPGVHVDAVGLTSYPYLEYDAPADIPADYYDEVAARWDGPVLFSEIGWLAAPSGPYPGGEAQQEEFIAVFFDRAKALPLGHAAWLFLHDWDGQAAVPAFAGIGLRDNSGAVIRPADSAWRAAVALRQP